MLRFLFVMSVVFVASCLSTDDNPGHEDQEVQQSTESSEFYRDEAWVCYHPGTDMHNTECIEADYPQGCYVEGNSSVFCWLLMKPECEEPEKHPAAQKVCHLLRR